MNACRWAGARSVTALGWVARVVVFLGVFGGCGSGGEPVPVAPVEDVDPAGCAPGEWLRDDGSCQPAGLPLDMPCPPGEWPNDHGVCQPAGLPLDMPCPPGEWLREDGGCQPAGVPPEDCAEGFAPDGNGGCEVILPAEDCPKGQMAIPGETVCHEVAPCGSGDYGDIPVDPATTQFVNQAYAGADSNGSEAKPWKTIQQGIDAAASGAIVAVAAGSYAEDARIQGKPVVLWGRCPALVEVAGTGAELSAMEVLHGYAAASEIRGLAITGLGNGIAVVGVIGVVIEGVWVHDTKDQGIDIEDAYGPTSVRVTASLIEATHSLGVFISGSDAELSGVVVRNIQPGGPGDAGRGIGVQYNPQTKERANVQVTASVVERAHDTGVFVAGSDAVLSGILVRDILLDGAGNPGRGISVQNFPVQNFPDTTERGKLQVTASVVERTNTGVLVSGSDAELSGVAVRDILPYGSADSGEGIHVQLDPETNERANVQITASVIERTCVAGVSVSGSDAELLGVVVRDILPDGAGFRGRGIHVQPSPETNDRANVQVTASVVEETHESGVYVAGSDAVLSGVVVRDILPNEAGIFGRGIEVDVNIGTEANERGKVQVTASVIERTHDAGVHVSGSDAELSWVAVRDILPNGVGIGGRGLSVQNDAETNNRANAKVTASMVERTHDLGVFVTNSDAVLSGVVVRDILSDGAGALGTGIAVQDGRQTNERANVQVTASVVERTHETGVVVFGSDVVLSGVVVRDILPNGAGYLGTGIQVLNNPKTNERAAVHIMASLVERSRQAGVMVLDSAATIEGLIVRQTSADEDGRFGDGIVVWADSLPAEVTITGTIVDSNARAGLANWGAPARFASTVLSCNGFDLQGEVYEGSPFSFPDSHDNLCGCPAAADVCNAVSTGISPPLPLDDLPIPDSPSSP